MNKILVTGGAGFIGSHLVDRLVREDLSVRVLDNFEPQVHQGKKPKYLNKSAEYIEGDVRNETDLKKALKNIDCLFHLAAKVGVGQSMYEIKDYVSSNTHGTSVLLDFIINNKIPIKKIVVASSMSIYGEGMYSCKKCGEKTPYIRDEKQLKKRRWELECPDCKGVLTSLPTGESKRPLSTSIYALTKKDQEELCMITGISYKIPVVALRFFNVYGPRQSLSNPYTGACAIFSSRIKNDRPPLIYEDGLQTRDFIDVRDIVEACILAMRSSRADYRVLNVGTGKPVSIIETARMLIKLYGKKLSPEIANKFRMGDIRHCYSDIQEISKIGFKPRYSLGQGMKNLVEWGREEESRDMTDKADRILDEFNLKI